MNQRCCRWIIGHVAFVALLTSACSAVGPAPVPTTAPVISLFEAAVHVLADSVTGASVLVDPRPVRDGAALGAMFSHGIFAPDDDGEADERGQILHSLGFQSVDSRTLSSCPGSQIIDATGHSHDACPSRPEVVILVGSTRPVGAKPDTAVLPALRISRSRGGSELQEYQLVAARGRGGWRIVRVTPTVIVE